MQRDWLPKGSVREAHHLVELLHHLRTRLVRRDELDLEKHGERVGDQNILPYTEEIKTLRTLPQPNTKYLMPWYRQNWYNQNW